MIEGFLGAKAMHPPVKAAPSGIESKAAGKAVVKAPIKVNPAAVSKAGPQPSDFSQSVHSLGNVSVVKVTCQQCNIPKSSHDNIKPESKAPVKPDHPTWKWGFQDPNDLPNPIDSPFPGNFDPDIDGFG